MKTTGQEGWLDRAKRTRAENIGKTEKREEEQGAGLDRKRQNIVKGSVYSEDSEKHSLFGIGSVRMMQSRRVSGRSLSMSKHAFKSFIE